MTVQLPPKRPGEHRWIALVTFALTPGQAAAAHAGSMVKLGPHNQVIQSVGCIDCETGWPASARCTAAAAPEMDDVTGARNPGLTPDDQERLLAAVDAIGRTGAKGFEVGHLNDDVPSHLARWYASAQYKGARVASEEHPGPVEAAEGLLWKVLEGGQCVRCKATIGIEGHAYPDDPQAGERCLWRRVGPCWVPGCLGPDDVDGYIAARTSPGTTGPKR